MKKKQTKPKKRSEMHTCIAGKVDYPVACIGIQMFVS